MTAFHENTVLDALTAIHQCPVPVVALIQGVCAGGGLEIASVCDLRIAGHGARLGIPIRTLGFSWALAEMQWLVRLTGPAVAAELLYEGRMLSAQEALAKGLLTRVVDDELAEQEAQASALRIAESAPLATRAHKTFLRRLSEDPSPVTREERLASYAFADTEDYRIGVRAFLDKVLPVFWAADVCPLTQLLHLPHDSFRSSTRRFARSRPFARAFRAVLLHDPGRLGGRGHQDRACAPRRHGASMGALCGRD